VDPATPGRPQPYFAMEYVPHATTLLDFAREHPVRRRIELFLDVCDAVHHGHQRGVLHRDLKPSNILIDADAPEARPKVIDFGVARCTDADLTIPRTDAGLLVGTLRYMSPEQTRAAPDELDVRSDVYTLGVVLHELLLGAMPYDVADRPLTEVARIIQEQSPARPMGGGALPRDLDTIIRTALEKDPDRRYASVSALAADLRRFLAREPIAARPPRLGYVAWMFARRHTAIVLSVVIIAIVLVAASAVSVRAAIRARRSADAERQQRLVAEQVSGFLHGMLDLSSPHLALGREVTVRELLDEAALVAETELATSPAAARDVMITLGRAYRSLGAYEDAQRLLEHAIALHATLDPDDAVRADALANLGNVLVLRGRYAEAGPYLDDAVEIGRRLESDDPAPLIEALLGAAELDRLTARSDEAIAHLDDAERAILRLATDHSRLIEVTGARGLIAYNERRLDDARIELQRAADLARASLPPQHPAIAGALTNLGNVLFDLGDFDDAASAWNDALAIQTVLTDGDHPRIATLLNNLALLHAQRGDHEESQRLFDECLAVRRRRLGDDHPDVVGTLARKGWLLVDHGDIAAGRACLEEAVAVGRPTVPEADFAYILGQLAFAAMSDHDLETAERAVAEAVDIQRRILPARHPRLAQNLALTATIRLKAARPEAAEIAARESLAIRIAAMPDHWLTANSTSVLGECLLARGRLDEAEPLLLDADARLRAALGPTHPRRLESVRRIVALYDARRDDAAAAHWRDALPDDGSR
ncbi:MAG: tetratricopeptide repeat protein, partial [Phycisphaerales bacterium]|nr:tetratricopeptide repeat protein [Phycisphaerales bacterium]